MCQCWWARSGCTNPVPFFDTFLFQRSSRPAPARTRYTLEGLAATRFWSIIMNVKGHAGEANEFLEVLRDELGAVVRDDTWPFVGMRLVGARQDALDVGLGHLLADLPVHDGAAGPVEDGAQIVECAAKVEVGDVDVPMLMGAQRLHEPGAFLRHLLVPAVEQAGA